MTLSSLRFLPLVMLWLCAMSWAPAQSRQAKVNWLQEHAAPIAIHDSVTDYSDLAPLKKAIGDTRIVLLGEQSHSDGTTFEAKVRLVKFLHQEMGFEVVAFESPMWDCHLAWERLQAGEPHFPLLDSAVFSLWTQAEQNEPLFEYLETQAHTDHPLALAGFDCQTHFLTLFYFKSHFMEMLEQQFPTYANSKEVQRLRPIFDQLSKNDRTFRDVAPAEQVFFHHTLDSLSRAFRTLPDWEESGFWAQHLRSYNRNAYNRWNYNYKAYDQNPDSLRALRDRQMAENLLWMANGPYAGKKIILWGASLHFIRNLQDSKVSYYQTIETMGHVLQGNCEEPTYFIGFDASSGTLKRADREPVSTLKPGKASSFSGLMVKAGFENAFLDFRSIPPDGAWLNEPLIMRPLGYGKHKMVWPQQMDGVIFTRKMEGARQRSSFQPAK